jgi:hypothetical protein
MAKLACVWYGAGGYPRVHARDDFPGIDRHHGDKGARTPGRQSSEDCESIFAPHLETELP